MDHMTIPSFEQGWDLAFQALGLEMAKKGLEWFAQLTECSLKRRLCAQEIFTGGSSYLYDMVLH